MCLIVFINVTSNLNAGNLPAFKLTAFKLSDVAIKHLSVAMIIANSMCLSMFRHSIKIFILTCTLDDVKSGSRQHWESYISNPASVLSIVFSYI